MNRLACSAVFVALIMAVSASPTPATGFKRVSLDQQGQGSEPLANGSDSRPKAEFDLIQIALSEQQSFGPMGSRKKRNLENPDFLEFEFLEDDEVLEEFPFSVVIQFESEGTWYFICGGTLVSSNIIVTAANCFYTGYRYRALLGSNSYNLIPGSDTQVIEIIAVDVANGYMGANSFNSSGYFRDNIALMYLAFDAVFTDTVNPIPLATEVEDWVGETCYVAGHGYRQESEDPNGVRKVDELTVISDFECQVKLIIELESLAAYVHSPSQLCTSDNGKGQCYGDWGNALICDDEFVGIVSYIDFRCLGGVFDIPVGYTNVAYYSSLINFIILNAGTPTD